MYKKENKNKKNLEKKEKGITLVALVITVVVMLILAGVAISVVVDGDGLFSRTRRAVEIYENVAREEGYTMQSMINEIDEYLGEKNNGGGDPVISGPIAEVVSVGDFVNYDAGTWNEADFTKITSSAGNPTVNKSEDLPTTQGEFGGFAAGQSRNSNSKPYSTSYIPEHSGWRVWDIDESIGEITLISAGHPETYYHERNSSAASTNILRNRDCSMYENEYAKSGSAHILTGQEAAEWYNKQFRTNYTIVDNGGSSSSTFYAKAFTTAEPISVLENGSYYWLASPYNIYDLYDVNPYDRDVGDNYNHAFGVRVLVSLESDVQVKEGTATGGVTTWDIVGN